MEILSVQPNPQGRRTIAELDVCIGPVSSVFHDIGGLGLWRELATSKPTHTSIHVVQRAHCLIVEQSL